MWFYGKWQCTVRLSFLFHQQKILHAALGIMTLSENAQLVVLELVMDYVSPKEISTISAVHPYLQRKASSFFRKAIRGFEVSDYSPDDLKFKKSSFESVHVIVSADFSDIGRCFYYVCHI